jgi:hypothetical protein
MEFIELILLVCLDFLFSRNPLIVLISEILLSIAFYFGNERLTAHFIAIIRFDKQDSTEYCFPFRLNYSLAAHLFLLCRSLSSKTSYDLHKRRTSMMSTLFMN